MMCFVTLFEAPPAAPRPPRDGRRSGARRTGVLAIVVAVIGVALFAGTLIQAALSGEDGWRPPAPGLAAPDGGLPRHGEPSAAAVELADRMPLTAEGRELFLSTAPEIVDGDGIRTRCDSAHRAAAEGSFQVLGCYRSDHRIAVFQAADPRLHDTTVITAAHELLHAVYAGLDDAERDLVDRLITEEAARLPADDPIHAQIDASVGDHTGSLANERFAYLGTQVQGAGGFAAELEGVYGRYISDRAALVEMHRRAESVIPQANEALRARWDEVSALEQANAQEEAQLSADRGAHEAALASYNADADEFNATPPELRAQYASIVTYPDGRTERMSWEAALAARYAELEAFRADIEARGAALEAEKARAAQLRADAEAAQADLEALIDAATPD